MLIIESNLASLAEQKSICDLSLVERFCLTIRLGKEVYHPRKTEDGALIEVTYDHTPEPETLFDQLSLIDQNLELLPGESVIGCSFDLFSIPLNCFGLLQTKGTLARMFVSITCNDGQIEPGFQGKVTLEITNNSPWKVKIPLKSHIGQLYIFRCTTTAQETYSGRYAELAKVGPTIPIWGKW
jgi:dCTP deaminase